MLRVRIALNGALLSLTLALAACGGGGGGGGGGGSNNTAPIANAGPDQLVLNAQQVSLDGTASADADPADTLIYTWTFTSVPAGSAVTDADLSDPNAVSPTFVPDVVGDYILQLTVDDSVATHNDSVTITSTTGNIPPVANAGVGGNAYVGVAYFMDGTGSTDANGDALTYLWEVLSVPVTSAVSTASLSSTTSATPSFIPDVAGDYQLSLLVNDGSVDSNTAATVTITAEAIPSLASIVPNLAMDLEMFSDGRVDPPVNISGVTFEGWAICEPPNLTVEPVASATPPNSIYGCTHNITSVTHTVAPGNAGVTFVITADRLYAGFDASGTNMYGMFGATQTSVYVPLTQIGPNLYRFDIPPTTGQLTYSTFSAILIIALAETEAATAAGDIMAGLLYNILTNNYYYVSLP